MKWLTGNIANSLMDPNLNMLLRRFVLPLRKKECTVALHKTSVSTRFAFRESYRPSESKLVRGD